VQNFSIYDGAIGTSHPVVHHLNLWHHVLSVVRAASCLLRHARVVLCTAKQVRILISLPHTHTHTLTQTHLMALCPGLPRWAGTRKIKPIWIILKQETASGTGISWSICKSAPRSRQITTPAPHHSVFTGRMLFLTPNQQRWRQVWFHNHIKIISWQYLLCYAPIHAQHDISVANKVFSNFNSATLPVFSWSWSRV